MDRVTEVSRPFTARSAAWTTTTGGKVGLAVAGVFVLATLGYGGVRLFSGSPQAAKAEPLASATNPATRPTPAAPINSNTPTPTPAAPAAAVPGSGDSTGTDAPVSLSLGRGAEAQPTTPPPSNPATSTPVAPTPGRPAGVDVTRPDLTPTPSTSAPGSSTPGGGPAPTGATGTQPTGALPSTGSSASVRALIEEGDRAMSAGNPVQARVLYSRAYLSTDITRADQSTLRDKMSAISEDLIFSPRIASGDPMVEAYTVASGDSLVRIAKRRELGTDWRLIQRINRISNPSALKVGQKLKLIRGPFHAVVHKGDFRLDLFQGSPDEPERWQYIRSFRVGLGAGNSTPLGTFVIRPNSKLVNPHWVNPRDGTKFDANDPKNPIGEFWLGWQGLGDSAIITGYGLHGTIEPESIGSEKSMGCVRLGDADIALLYELLVEQISMVKVVP
jgi:LysM repeat protein